MYYLVEDRNFMVVSSLTKEEITLVEDLAKGRRFNSLEKIYSYFKYYGWRWLISGYKALKIQNNTIAEVIDL